MEDELRFYRLKTQLAKDLVYLHDNNPFISPEIYPETYGDKGIDSQVLEAIADDEVQIERLENLRLELWEQYTLVILGDIDFLIDDLIRNFADVGDLDKKFKSLSRGFDKRPPQEEIKEYFDKATALRNDIMDSGRSLLHIGRVKFLSTYFPTYAVLVSVLWAGLFTGVNALFDVSGKVLLPVGFVSWFVIIFCCYHAIRLLFRRGIGEK